MTAMPTQAVKLRETALTFNGPMPNGAIDETRVPAKGNQVAPLVDPLSENEQTAGLILDYGRLLGQS